MTKITTLLMAMLCLLIFTANAQISITNSSPYTQDFNSLPTAANESANPFPANWLRYANPTSPAKDTIRITTGTANSGSFYSVGAASNTERAFGLLLSAAVKPLYLGLKFINNTGSTIVSADVSYRCEQWRRGNNTSGKADSLLFEYINTTDSIHKGVWTNVPELMGNSVVTGTTVGALDGNTNFQSKSHTITGLNVPNGGTFWIRFNDYDIAGSEDLLAVDDFSISFSTGSLPACTTPAANATNLVLTPATTSVSGSFTASASADKYLVVRSSSATLGQTPVNGTTYTPGSAFGSGVVVQATSSTTFNATGLTASTQYFFFVFALNDVCTGGPNYFTTALTGNTTTLTPVIPNCTQPTGVSSSTIIKLDSTTSTIQIKWTNASNADSVLVFAAPNATVGFVTLPDSVYFPVGSQIPSSGSTKPVVYYRGTDSSTTLTGLLTNTVYKIFVVSFNNKDCNFANYAGLSNVLIRTAAGTDCQQPSGVSNSSIVKLDSTGTTISLKWTNPANADSVMVLAAPNATVGFVTIRDSVYYGVGTTIPSSTSTPATVYYRGTDSSTTLTGLTPNTVYKIFIVSFKNVSCTNGPNYAGIANTTIKTAVSTGIRSNRSEAQLTIYPNPVQEGVLNVKFTSLLKEDANIEVLDVLGRKMSTIRIPSGNGMQTLIDVSNFAKGTYILHVIYKGESSTSTFIVD